MGEVIRLSALFSGRARSKPREPRLPTRHLPELVALPLPELVDLSSMKDAPAPWHGAPVLVTASMWWGRCIGIEPATGRLVLLHRIAGEVLFRSYAAAELRLLRESDPRSAR